MNREALNTRKILLVEDNFNDIELALEALTEENLGERVVVANDGVEAIDYLLYQGIHHGRRKENPAVIFLDIKMPRMDGIEVLQMVKGNAELKTIPVVMLSSSREETDLQRCYDLGANAFVVKPLGFNDFMNAVKQLGIFWVLLNELPQDGGLKYEQDQFKSSIA
ncbi:MAG TPA: response regulator [Prolixibacteraceae bacterium]|nr:response regulator [Prolixibacteraceae bacterium]